MWLRQHFGLALRNGRQLAVGQGARRTRCEVWRNHELECTRAFWDRAEATDIIRANGVVEVNTVHGRGAVILMALVSQWRMWPSICRERTADLTRPESTAASRLGDGHQGWR